ncbi:MAG: hypothetical protein J6Q68_00015 [Clostridia bacterium]|nr:hypothetical protein [Clostridia bacterium]
MLFGRSEKKRSSTPAILMIGALAVVGAASITNKGKQLISNTVDKCKSIVNKKKDDMMDMM